MSRFGIIAALPGELKPLVHGGLVRGASVCGWQPLTPRAGSKGDAAWVGRIGQAECIAVAAGMGQAAATRACAIAEQEGPLDALVSVGWAGALSCGVSSGEAYVLAEVVDGQSEERFPATLAAGSSAHLKLVTLDHVARSPEKRGLAQHFQTVLVDMEAAAVARVAQEKGIAFYCFKAVTDGYGELLPDFSRYIDAEGKLKIYRLVAHVALRPKYWRPMARMENNSKTGAEAIAKALREFLANAG